MSIQVTLAHFLLSAICQLLYFILWLRIALRYHRVSPLHPVGRPIFQTTNRFLLPIERYFYRVPPRWDWIGFGAILLIAVIEACGFSILFYGIFIPSAIGLWTLGLIISVPCNLLFYALLIYILLTFFPPNIAAHPARAILNLVIHPFLRLGHKVIPNISGFDFAPFILLILLKVITSVISTLLPPL